MINDILALTQCPSKDVVCGSSFVITPGTVGVVTTRCCRVPFIGECCRCAPPPTAATTPPDGVVAPGAVGPIPRTTPPELIAVPKGKYGESAANGSAVVPPPTAPDRPEPGPPGLGPLYATAPTAVGLKAYA